MFDKLTEVLQKNGPGLHAFAEISRLGPRLAAQSPDHAAGLMLLANAANEFVETFDRMPLSDPMAKEMGQRFEVSAAELGAAWQGGDTARKFETLNTVARRLSAAPDAAAAPVTPPSFAERFAQIAARHSGFCFGADPSPEVLRDWSLPVSVEGLARFVDIVLEAAEGSVGILKPQVAFYEAFGPRGMIELERLIQGAKARGLLVIADAKRTDIGNSVAAYGRAWFGAGGFDADAVTASAYLGLGTLTPLFERARDLNRAVFVVVRSSNPEGAALQSADMGGAAVADRLAEAIRADNARLAPGAAVGPVGAVVGATLGADATRTVENMPNALFLVPGLGAQGATFDDMQRIFGAAAPRVIASSSRGVLAAGPGIGALRSALAEHVAAAMRLQAQ